MSHFAVGDLEDRWIGLFTSQGQTQGGGGGKTRSLSKFLGWVKSDTVLDCEENVLRPGTEYTMRGKSSNKERTKPQRYGGLEDFSRVQATRILADRNGTGLH